MQIKPSAGKTKLWGYNTLSYKEQRQSQIHCILRNILTCSVSPSHCCTQHFPSPHHLYERYLRQLHSGSFSYSTVASVQTAARMDRTNIRHCFVTSHVLHSLLCIAKYRVAKTYIKSDLVYVSLAVYFPFVPLYISLCNITQTQTHTNITMTIAVCYLQGMEFQWVAIDWFKS